mgnify:CR=1 FL=1
MSMTDPIADLLTRIRNASSAQHRSVDIPASGIKREISRVLAEERFIDNFAYYEDGKQGQLRLYLRYDDKSRGLIRGIRRASQRPMPSPRDHRPQPAQTRARGSAMRLARSPSSPPLPSSSSTRIPAPRIPSPSALRWP